MDYLSDMNSDYYGEASVGPTNMGTYNPPMTAQPVNQQWDTGGGGLGQYTDDVFAILAQGVGAWSQYKRNEQFLDYQRYEATQGGVYQQGRPAGGIPVGGTVTARATISPTTLLLIAGAAFLLLRK